MVLYDQYPHHHLLLFCAQEILYMVLGNERHYLRRLKFIETSKYC